MKRRFYTIKLSVLIILSSLVHVWSHWLIPIIRVLWNQHNSKQKILLSFQSSWRLKIFLFMLVCDDLSSDWQRGFQLLSWPSTLIFIRARCGIGGSQELLETRLTTSNQINGAPPSIFVEPSEAKDPDLPPAMVFLDSGCQDEEDQKSCSRDLRRSRQHRQGSCKCTSSCQRVLRSKVHRDELCSLIDFEASSRFSSIVFALISNVLVEKTLFFTSCKNVVKWPKFV